MIKRKLHALLLAGAMMLSLTVCGTNAASPSHNEADSSSDVPQSPAAAEFAAHLPLSFHMTDYAKREKHANMDFSIDDFLLENITVGYESGDIICYPPGPTYASILSLC